MTRRRIPSLLGLFAFGLLAGCCLNRDPTTPGGAWNLFAADVRAENVAGAMARLSRASLANLGDPDELDLTFFLVSPRFKQLIRWLPCPREELEGPGQARLKFAVKPFFFFFGPRIREREEGYFLEMGGASLPLETWNGYWHLAVRKDEYLFCPRLVRDSGRWYLVIPVSRAGGEAAEWRLDLPALRAR